MAEITAKEDFLTFADVSQETAYYDDWLFSSTKRYQYINMYETDKSIGAAQWYGAESQYICLGTSEMSNNDLLIYKLPDLNHEEVDVLSKDRELSILAAAKCENPCFNLVSAPSTFMDPNIVARTESSSSVIFLHTTSEKLSESTITSISPLYSLKIFDKTVDPLAINLVASSTLVCASLPTNINWYNVTTKQRIAVFQLEDATSSLSEAVSSIQCSDEDICFVCGSKSGRILAVDKRSPSAYTTLASPSKDRSKSWTMLNRGSMETVAVNDNNDLYIYDQRNPGTVKIKATLQAPPWTGRKYSSNLSLQTFGDYISVSGKDNKVRIYNAKYLQEETVLQTSFTHDGHLPDMDGGDLPLITTHSWHRKGKPRILSATNTGQLHTWMFVDELT